jgi:hypothetical protein
VNREIGIPDSGNLFPSAKVSVIFRGLRDTIPDHGVEHTGEMNGKEKRPAASRCDPAFRLKEAEEGRPARSAGAKGKSESPSRDMPR